MDLERIHHCLAPGDTSVEGLDEVATHMAVNH